MKLLFLAFCVVGAKPPDHCGCLSAPPDSETHWGHQNIALNAQHLVKAVRGRVTGCTDGKPLSGVLVEIYNHPDVLSVDPVKEMATRREQKRIAMCITEASGRFCFKNVPPGRYELRGSKAPDWNSTSVFVEIDPKRGHDGKSGIQLPMCVAE